MLRVCGLFVLLCVIYSILVADGCTAHAQIIQFPPDVPLIQGVPEDFGSVTVEVLDDTLSSPAGMSFVEMQTAPNFPEGFGGKDNSLVGFRIRRSASSFRKFSQGTGQAAVNVVIRFTFPEPTSGIVNLGQFHSSVNQQMSCNGEWVLPTFNRFIPLGDTVITRDFVSPPEPHPDNPQFVNATEIVWSVHSFTEVQAIHDFGIQFDVDVSESPLQLEGLKFLDGLEEIGFAGGIAIPDNIYGTAHPSPTMNPIKQKIHLVGQVTVPGVPTTMAVRIESREWGAPDFSSVIQTVQIFNLVTNQWDELDSRFMETFDVPLSLPVPEDPIEYINPQTGEVTLGVIWGSTQFIGAPYFWFIDVDEFTLEVQ